MPLQIYHFSIRIILSWRQLKGSSYKKSPLLPPICLTGRTEIHHQTVNHSVISLEKSPEQSVDMTWLTSLYFLPWSLKLSFLYKFTVLCWRCYRSWNSKSLGGVTHFSLGICHVLWGIYVNKFLFVFLLLISLCIKRVSVKNSEG